MESIEPKAKYYVRLYDKEEHRKEFCSGYLYMKNVKSFSKYDDDLINDITEGKVCNETDGAIMYMDGVKVGYNISILIPNWYVFCLYELFEEDFESSETNFNVISKKFGQFVTSYLNNKEKCYFALIDTEKFDNLINDYFDNLIKNLNIPINDDLKNKIYLYRRVEFVEYDPAKRMENYFNGNAISLLFQKRPIYREKLSEKRLCVFCPNKEKEKDFIRLKIEGLENITHLGGVFEKSVWLKAINKEQC